MFSDFIAECGVKPLALVCGVSPSTIRAWKSLNHIPARRWAAILEAYPKVKWRDLVDMDYASRQKVAA
jgi:hypothetical protein